MTSLEHSQDFQELALLMANRLNERVVAQMKAIQERTQETDPKLLMLPHPARIVHMKYPELAKLTYGEEWPVASKLIADNSITLHETGTRLIEASPFFRYSYGASSYSSSGTNGGNANNTLLALRFILNRGHVFQTTDALDLQLQHTDIADNIPVSQIRPPYPITYFEFGQSRTSPFISYNVETGAHIAEGCYLFEQKTDRYKGQPYKEHRHLVIMLTGMPKANIADDATNIYTIPILDEEWTISETIEKFLSFHREDIERGRRHSPGMRLTEADPKEIVELEKILKHLMKIMLYLSTPKAIKATENERSTLEKSIGAKAGGKKAKLERKMDRTYDRIVIGPKELPKPQDFPAGTGIRHVTPHWRRGHFRDQRHGEGFKLTKTIFIEPQLIAAERVADSEVSIKTYVVKE
jgi:hypothetical protein